jgi:hypothetical protein
MNAPSRSDSYLLPEGAQKVTYEKDTKISNAGKFTILREDHTMGNLIRMCVPPCLTRTSRQTVNPLLSSAGSCCATRT